MAHLAAAEEALDKIAMLRMADQAGRLLTIDPSIELSKYAGALMAKLAGPATVLGRLATKAPMAAKLTGSTTAARHLLGTAPTMGVGQAIRPPTSMGDVAQRMMKTPAPVGSVAPKVTGAQTAVGKLMGNTPTALPGQLPAKPLGVTDPGRMAARIQPGPATVPPTATKPDVVTAKGQGTVGIGPGRKPASAAARDVHPEMKAGRDNYRSDPSAQAEVRSNLKARGVPDAEISNYHNAMMGEGYAPVEVPRGGAYGTPQPKPAAPAVAGASPSGYHPMPGAMPVSPQGAAAAHVAPGPATPAPAYTPRPTPAAQPYAAPAQVAPPGTGPGIPTKGQYQEGALKGKPTIAMGPEAKGQMNLRKAEHEAGQRASKAEAKVRAKEDAAVERTLAKERAPGAPGQVTPGPTTPEASSGASGAPGAATGAPKKKGGHLGAKALGLGALGLGAYGLTKAVPWAARQLEQGGGGSMAYGGGWSPVPYGYGYSPYGAGASGATV